MFLFFISSLADLCVRGAMNDTTIALLDGLSYCGVDELMAISIAIGL